MQLTICNNQENVTSSKLQELAPTLSGLQGKPIGNGQLAIDNVV
jgi:hypothetical protein